MSVDQDGIISFATVYNLRGEMVEAIKNLMGDHPEQGIHHQTWATPFLAIAMSYISDAVQEDRGRRSKIECCNDDLTCHDQWQHKRVSEWTVGEREHVRRLVRGGLL